jgi:uncharacterized membrane protein YtjA (UPF0391 family)
LDSRFPLARFNRCYLKQILALIAEAFGAGGLAGDASWIAHVLLAIAVILILISFVTGRRGPPAI